MPATVTPAPDSMCCIEHLAGVHPVDVVGAEHEDVVGVLVVDDVEVLEDRVGRARGTSGAPPHLRGHRGDVVAEQGGQRQVGDVDVEAVALVLGEHDDLAVAAVDQVRQREVDEAVVPPKGTAGLARSR
jgi:hypothetical protein